MIDDRPDSATCPTCRPGRPLTSGRRVCVGCELETASLLAELVELHALASTVAALTPGQHADPGPIGAHREPPIPLRVDTLDLALGEALLSTDLDLEEPPWSGLESWERDWRRQFNLTRYGPATAHRPRHRFLTDTVKFLTAWWPRAAQLDPYADDFVHDIRRMHGQALAALPLTRADLDPKAEDPADYHVDCPRIDPDTGLLCGHRIPMWRQPRTVPTDDDHRAPTPPAVTVNCPRCGWHGPATWLVKVAIDSGSELTMTAAQTQAVLGISEPTLRRRIADGHITRIGRDRYRVRHADRNTAT